MFQKYLRSAPELSVFLSKWRNTTVHEYSTTTVLIYRSEPTVQYMYSIYQISEYIYINIINILDHVHIHDIVYWDNQSRSIMWKTQNI